MNIYSDARRSFLAWWGEAATKCALGPLAILAACESGTRTSSVRKASSSRLNVEWHRQNLTADLLGRWVTFDPEPNGALKTLFTSSWQPKPTKVIHLLGQVRMIYAFTVTYELTKEVRCLELAQSGARFLTQRLRDPLYGGYYWSVDLNGRPVGTHKRCYDHAFALLALTELYRVQGGVEYRDEALQLWSEIDRGFTDSAGGVVGRCSRSFVQEGGPRSQNPLMHLFEALIALHRATADRSALIGLKRLGNFVSHRLLQGLPESDGGGAFIPEFYTPDWAQPLNSAQEGYVDLGHQFEWVHLMLDSASELSLFRLLSERVMIYALGTGYDEIDGGCWWRAYPDRSPAVDRKKGWWQQVECLHALLRFGQETGRPDIWRRYEQTVSLIQRELINPQGGWYAADALPCHRGGCLDEQPDPYHMVSLHRAALASH